MIEKKRKEKKHKPHFLLKKKSMSYDEIGKENK